MKTAIAVLVSGSGTNLQSIIDKTESGYIPAEIKCVISNREDAFGLKRAENHNIPNYYVDSKKFDSRDEHERGIINILKKHDIELVVLAGYMRLLTSNILNEYKNRVINIHPAILPSFPGTDGYGDAWEYGVKVSGCTVHFVDEGCDTGPIILQRVNEIKEGESLEDFKKRGLEIEHEAFPLAIKLYCEGKLKIEGRKVSVLG
ncbi:phosphoribosylglycinamide formyltransferase [Spirochaetota bacterium]